VVRILIQENPGWRCSYVYQFETDYWEVKFSFVLVSEGWRACICLHPSRLLAGTSRSRNPLGVPVHHEWNVLFIVEVASKRKNSYVADLQIDTHNNSGDRKEFWVLDSHGSIREQEEYYLKTYNRKADLLKLYSIW
jgi:hypothetical protein